MKKSKEESEEKEDVFSMTSTQRAERTRRSAVYHSLLHLNRAVFDANKAGVDIGPIADVDLQPLIEGAKIDQKLSYSSKVGAPLK